MKLRNILSTILAVFFCLGSNLLAYSGGDGLSEATAYKIATKTDLLELAADTDNYDKCFILTENINLTGETFTRAPIAPDTDSSTEFFQGTQFTGILDGNGHTLSNLTITASTNDFIGLFGVIGSGGQIRNLGVEDVNITGGIYVGGLVGYSYYCTITSCTATGIVSGTGRCVGGLVGLNNEAALTSCYATSAVSGSDYSVGGLVGYNYSSSLTSCYATGTVSGTGSVGGLVGSNDGSLTTCYATGTVSGTGYSIGGLVGENGDEGTLTSCYATGAISGTGSYVGGLVGWNDEGMLTSCYATGAVNGYSRVGGLVGWNFQWNSQGKVIRCYSTGKPTGTSYVGGLCGFAETGNGNEDIGNFWDRETSEMSTSAMGTGKTTAEMKTRLTFISAGWDFTNETANGTNDTWRMCVDGINYPKLTWQHIAAGDFACPDGVGTEDLNFYVGCWLLNTCTLANNYCNGTDMNKSGKVDLADFAIFANHWLEGI